METLLQDVRFALRILVKSPVFTTVAVLTLAIGIGANTAIFSLVDSVLLKMLPIRAPQELVIVGDSARVNNRSLGTPQTDNFSVPLYHEIRDNTTVFSGMYAAATAHRILVGDLGQASDAEANTVARIVTGNYFSVLGTGSAAGRLLTPEDDRVQHGHPVAVISYNYWQRKFSSSTGAIGTTVRLNGYPFTIIGVAQRGFSSDIVGEPIDLFVPLAMQAEVMRGRDWYRDRNASWLQIVARRKPGVSLSQIDANVNLAFQQILKGSFGLSLIHI